MKTLEKEKDFINTLFGKEMGGDGRRWRGDEVANKIAKKTHVSTSAQGGASMMATGAKKPGNKVKGAWSNYPHFFKE